MQAFSDIRVIDLTHVLAGPFCTYQLAVLGADVIKVEPPDAPDMSRASSAASHPHETEMGADFTAQNANKRAVCIDLRRDSGKAILRRLLARADVLVENYRSGALAALGFDAESVRAIKPDIVHCSLTGFGQRGPLSQRTAYDNVVQAYSGLMASTGDGDGAPMKVGPPVLDYGSGIQAAFAIASALYQRTRTGDGQYIDVAMLDAALMLMSSHVSRFHRFGEAAAPTGNRSADNAGYGCYPTRDGLLMLGAYTPQQAQEMWTVLGDRAYGDALMAMTPADATARSSRDRARIGAILLRKNADEWEIEFNRNQVPAAKVRTLDQALTDPHLAHRTVLQTTPDASAQTLPTAAFQYAEHGPTITRPPPRIGEHTEEVLREAGYDEHELTQLAEDGVIRIAQRD
ncbi:MAG: CaiB/BaiF CoA transferase family protein [bacterium]